MPDRCVNRPDVMGAAGWPPEQVCSFGPDMSSCLAVWLDGQFLSPFSCCCSSSHWAQPPVPAGQGSRKQRPQAGSAWCTADSGSGGTGAAWSGETSQLFPLCSVKVPETEGHWGETPASNWRHSGPRQLGEALTATGDRGARMRVQLTAAQTGASRFLPKRQQPRAPPSRGAPPAARVSPSSWQ